MFTVGTQYAKLKTNLRLVINRLKLLEKKKTELAQKSRKEIADYIAAHKEDRARIRVEHIIREDYMVEAYELLEMYCDLVLARFGLIQQMKNLDEGIEEAVNSILWASPRLQSEVPELKVISDQLTMKYGKPFAEACRQNQLGKVNEKIMAKLNVHAPPKIMVEKYMMEIAKSHGVPFTPDESVMRQDEVAAAEAMLIDFQNQGQQGYGWMYPPNPAFQQNNQGPPGVPPGPPGGLPPPGGNSGGGGGGGFTAGPMPVSQASGQSNAFNYPQINTQIQCPPPNYEQSQSQESGHDMIKIPLNQDPMGRPSAPPTLPALPDPPAADFPAIPKDQTPPANGEGKGSGEDLDFDDLSRRFEELKKRR